MTTAYAPASGDAVVIATYVTVTTTISILAVRLTLTRIWKRRLGWDDGLLVVAGLLAIAQSVMTQKAAEASSVPYIRSGNFLLLDRIFKLNYSSDLVFLAILATSRASVICLMHRMVPPQSLTRRMSPIMHSINLVWTTFSIFAAAFQCSLPMPWIYLPSRCVASGVLWYPILIVSILVDVFLSTAIFPELPNLPFKPTQKKIIAIMFASRSLVCAVGVVHLALLAPALRSENQPRDMLTPNILRQIVLNLSILAAAIPALYKPASTAQHASTAPKDLESPLDSPTPSTRRRRFFSFYKQHASKKQSSGSEKNSETSSVPMSSLPVLKLPFGDDFNRASKFGMGSFMKSDHKRAGSSQDLIISESVSWYVSHDLEKDPVIILPKPEPALKS